MKRSHLVIALLVLLGLAGAAVYVFLIPPGPGRTGRLGFLPIIGGRAPLPPPPAPPGAGTSGPRTGESAPLKQIVAKDVLAPALSADQKSLYYVDRTSGHLLASDLEGNNERTVVNLTILETFDGLWSPSRSHLILAYAEGGQVKRFVEPVASGTPSYFLPPETTAAAWSPDGKSLAYLLRRGETTNLVIADQSNRNARTVFSTPVPDFALAWPSSSAILLISRPSGLAPSLALRVDPTARRADLILAGARGLIALPSPDGGELLISRSSNQGRAEALAAYRFSDSSVREFRETTLAEKCAYAPKKKRVLCGIPAQDIPAPAPDLWYRGAASFSDIIAAIDPETNQSAVLMRGQADVDLITPFVSADERYLFFQDKKTGTVWRLDLIAKP